MRRALAALALVICSVGLVGCGDDDSSGDSTDLPTKTVDVTIEGLGTLSNTVTAAEQVSTAGAAR